MDARTDIDGAALPEALAAAVDALLSHRTAEGYWEGWLSSSALSTAVAAFALARAGGQRCAGIVGRALDWLTAHQNGDGGWGDTVASRSNLSTTVLCWCALSAADASGSDARRLAAERAGEYVARQCGSLAPKDIEAAVRIRYGNDRTFSAPILTMAALAGKLGPEPACWKHVAQLPFELGVLSHSMLRRLRLPVVSYALPALIAIGQVRHARRPTLNPLARLLRNLARHKTLARLRDIQPASGGYLEAAPLTSFVLMSLSALRSLGVPCGHAGTPSTPADETIARAVAFLRETARPDGAWPIDTNLATWVTTLSVNALPDDALDGPQRTRLRDWLLACQYRREHPYTQAAPGGWAWTDLSGGVPDADDTSGAIRALARLAPNDPQSIAAAAAGCRWLLDLQNPDGGLPTFCRGWGSLPFDRSCHDLTAHALLAWTNWLAYVGPEFRPRVQAGIERAVRFLIRSPRPVEAAVVRQPGRARRIKPRLRHRPRAAGACPHVARPRRARRPCRVHPPRRGVPARLPGKRRRLRRRRQDRAVHRGNRPGPRRPGEPDVSRRRAVRRADRGHPARAPESRRRRRGKLAHHPHARRAGLPRRSHRPVLRQALVLRAPLPADLHRLGPCQRP
jgi:squalene-hopene/tetraprenyl-beta-curcumene cyclase